jgi:hypothetical protein
MGMAHQGGMGGMICSGVEESFKTAGWAFQKE